MSEQDVNYSHNCVNSCDNNSCYFDDSIQHLKFLSYYFPYVSPPEYRKLSKCTHFGERRTAYRFGSTIYIYYHSIKKNAIVKRKEKGQLKYYKYILIYDK